MRRPLGRRREEAALADGPNSVRRANDEHHEHTVTARSFVLECGEGADQHHQAYDELVAALEQVERAGGPADEVEARALEVMRARALEHLADAVKAYDIEEAHAGRVAS